MYLTDQICPSMQRGLAALVGDAAAACQTVVDLVVDTLFRDGFENRLLAVRLTERAEQGALSSDLISGAILAAIVQRAKEQAIDRSI